MNSLRRHILLLAAWVLGLTHAAAQADTVLVVGDSVCVDPSSEHGLLLPRFSELRGITRDSDLTPLQKVKGMGTFMMRVIDAFDQVDSAYVERIGYNFTAMLQGTTNIERYSIGTRDYAEQLVFAQHPDFRLGPYFGWRWLFFGYTFDLTSIGKTSIRRGSKFEFSLYTSMIGADFIYRRTGTDFFIRRVEGLGEGARAFEGSDCNDYISTSVTGVNVYYNFNHRKFSNPAVFSQSTIQRRSAGSWQVGASVTSHDIRFDYSALPKELFAETEQDHQFSSLERVKYTDYSINGGYAYNWVFHRGWCLGLSVQPALGYKQASTKTALLEIADDPTSTDPEEGRFQRKMDEFFMRRGNLNFDFTGRLGLIYNTGRWFAGCFAVIHNYNYNRNYIHFHNTFGTANVICGFYFQKKKTAPEAGKPVKGGGVKLSL